jgi:hypothetical protein
MNHLKIINPLNNLIMNEQTQSPTDKRRAKVTKVTQMVNKDSYGNTSFIIEFGNGDKGYYTSKNENQNKFILGQDAEYHIESKQGKSGPYNKITPPKVEGQTFGGGGKPGFAGAAKQDPKVQMIGFAMSYTKDLIVGGKVDMKDLSATFDIIYNEMTSKL